MRARAALVAAVVALAVVLAAPAGAQATDPTPDGNGGWGQNGGTPGSSTPGAGGGGGGGGVPVDWILDFFPDGEGVGNEPGSQGCWGVSAVPQGQGGTYEQAVDELDQFGNNGNLWGPCAQETIDPAVVAGALWERTVRPPPPSPLAVAPGWALPGKRAFLEIGGEVPAVATYATPIGTARFVMTPRYVVSWGDGTSSETRTQGVPYPGGEGEVSHVYTDAGQVTIVVRAYWSATWTLAGDGGSLAELPTPTSADLPLPVEERQVVVR